MTLLHELRANEDQIGMIGVEAWRKARALGVPSYYIDADVGDGIVMELPDGSRKLLSPETSPTVGNDQAA